MARISKEDGFSLIELLIAIVILAMVAAALLGVYQISQQTFTRATSLEDAQLGTRAGLDRMASELRLIGAYWTGATGATDAITAASATSITFRADVDADTVTSGAETTATAAAATAVTVSANASAFNVYSTTALNDYLYISNGATREVKQVSSVAGSVVTLATALTGTYLVGSIVRSVETVTYTYNSSSSTLTRSVGGGSAETIVDNVTGLTLTYYDDDGNSLGASPTLSSIREIQISLTTQGSDGSRRTMTSRVRPRSLSF